MVFLKYKGCWYSNKRSSKDPFKSFNAPFGVKAISPIQHGVSCCSVLVFCAPCTDKVDFHESITCAKAKELVYTIDSDVRESLSHVRSVYKTKIDWCNFHFVRRNNIFVYRYSFYKPLTVVYINIIYCLRNCIRTTLNFCHFLSVRMLYKKTHKQKIRVTGDVFESQVQNANR